MAAVDISGVVFCPLVVLAMIAAPVVADEMAFVDVGADDTFNIRGLDVPVASARGTESFFLVDPMVAHDWAYTRVVSRSLSTELAAKPPTVATQRIQQFEEMLAPMYAALPKNEHGLLGNGTVRYALHRVFTKKRGWSIKGMEPAGGAWLQTMSVTLDVKQVTKYIVPTLLHEMILAKLGVKGVDLHTLAVVAATIEHLVRGETLDVVYSVYTTLGLPVGGRRTDAEAEQLLTNFLMVFGFGSDLEVSTAWDMRQAQTYLETHHHEWTAMQEMVRNALGTVRSQRGNVDGLDFDDMMLAVEDLERRYVQHHQRDCVRVKEQFALVPGEHNGRAPLAELKPSYQPGFRALFTESPEQLQNLGVLTLGASASSPNDTSKSELIMPNYVESQALCLTTASYFTICCPNECEVLIEQLELQVKAHATDPEELGQHVAALRPQLAVESKMASGFGVQADVTNTVSEPMVADLKTIAAQSPDGRVALHGGEFASWLHRALPMECPAPQADTMSGVGHGTNPRTADEWMADPSGDVGDTEEMMSEIADSLARYTILGMQKGDDSRATGEAPAWEDDAVVSIAGSSAGAARPQQGQGWFCGPALFRAAAMVSMIALVFTTCRSTMASQNYDGGKKFKQKQSGTWSESSFA